ncbi:PEP-CTERM sorting domain-containing protein [Microcoleus sp. PH2017_11_PCY_U_A]
MDPNVTVTSQRSVPEPSAILGLLAFGLTGFGLKQRLKKSKNSSTSIGS